MAQKKAPAKQPNKGGKAGGNPSGGKSSSGSGRSKTTSTANWGRHRIPPNPEGSGRKSRHSRGRGGK